MKNTIKTITLATITTIALTACGGGGGDSTPGYTAHPYDAPGISEADKNAYLSAVNNARSVGRSCGALGWYDATAPLTWNDGLYRAAYEHSQDMDATDYYEHEGSGTASDWTAQVQELGRGSYFGERTQNNNAPQAILQAENIAADYTSINSVMNAWLASDGHCSSIMDGSTIEFGMARVGNYWTQEFSGERL